MSERVVSRTVLGAVLGCAAFLSATTMASAQAQSDTQSLVPKSIRDRGTIRVGSQQTFPPVEFREPGKNEVVGVSADLLHEIARRLNLKIEYVHGEYAALIPGIDAERFDVASGGISDTEEREQVLDFINYMMSGGSILVRSENASQYKAIDDFCGKSVATLLGSRVIMAAVESASKKCTDGGKQPIQAAQLPNAPDARMQLDLKRVEGYLGDFPALVYMSTQFPGRYAIAGGNYILTPYVTSWGFSKKNTQLRDAMHKAAQSMLEDGTYKKILAKWGVDGAALPSISINLPSSKRSS
ncbi:ABC transporter substrate-binding protein [Microvirga sp. TS319]|uniref:ABC transporter substrate-binding protein n=1 Tax=Microvirga sp. TS319 TaxID=3241165 RepID=UPI00351A69A2